MKKYGFMGSCDFSLTVLRTLHSQGGLSFDVILTAPPRPKGRGHKVQKTCVHEYADTQGWPVWTPSSLKSEDFHSRFKELNLDIAIVASYRFIIPQPILDIPRWGCVNVHPSLLPRWRGPSPVISSLLAGDKKTGVCLMVMDQGLDTGPLLDCTPLIINPEETGFSLSQKLAGLGGQRLLEIMPLYMDGIITPSPQSAEGVVHSHKFTKEDAYLDWNHSAAVLERMIRAFHPKAWAYIHEIRVAISGSKPGEKLPTDLLPPGQIIQFQENWGISCGQGEWLIIETMTPDGGKTMNFESFLRGRCLEVISL